MRQAHLSARRHHVGCEQVVLGSGQFLSHQNASAKPEKLLAPGQSAVLNSAWF
jgi:hypothetical protein